MRPDDVVRLTHMRDAAASALRFVEGKGRAEIPEIPPVKERLSITLDGLSAPPDDPGKQAG